MLAPVVSTAFIDVITVESRGIQREALLALAVEAAGTVEAGGTGPAYVRLIAAFVVVYAGRLVLCEARGAFTGETTDRVDAQELTVVLLG